VGEKKKVLREFVSDLEDAGYEYRFVRGLALLLDRRCSFKCQSVVNPVELRRKIFEAAEKFGLPTTPERRQRILEAVALELSLAPANVEESLYADLDEELTLEAFNPPAASELLRFYNLSLAQTLLFESAELTFTASGNWQRLFYAVKKLGLIYDVQRVDGCFWVKVDGPASLFKLTKRYGVCIAKLLPTLVAAPEWSATGKILWKYTNEVCNFKLDSQKHGSLLWKPNLQSTVSYDSTVEEDFASQFKAVSSGWVLKREPEPVAAGNHVIIPDFSFERQGLKVFVEIVGFWTEEYLIRKAEKLKHVDAKMLLLVDESLACEKLLELEKRPQLHFIYYRGKIPLAPVLRYLEKTFEEIKEREVKFLAELPVKFTEPVVSYAEFAERTGLSVEAVKTVFTAKPPLGYVAMPTILVSKEKLEQINRLLQERLNPPAKLSLREATQIIESEGLSDASSALAQLGYRITWRGINSEQAEVSKTVKPH
jgi:predicted nuclease of restriction endonuclease-like RecB superfamily